jgi:hypothetical protein
MLGRVQQGLQQLYRIESELAVEDFVIDEEQRNAAGVARGPREQLLVQEDEDGLFLGLFVDPEVVAAASSCEPAEAVASGALGDFLLVVEGVSHFVYVAHKAGEEQAVSALELELQAEVDKYVTCLLSSEQTVARSQRLCRSLFHDVEYLEDLDAEELERYQVANASALRYCSSLESRFVSSRRVHEMLGELRRFYRLPLPGKLEWIRGGR